MVRILPLLAVVGVLLCAPAANAEVLQFHTPLGLTGAQENPPRDTPATGVGTALYDTDTLMLTVHLEWQDLLEPAQASHIHVPTAFGENGPVAVDFVPAGFPNVVSGTYDHVFDLDDAASYGAAFLGSFGGDVDLARDAVVQALIENRAYFNIHTSVFPPGEIRGNIAQIVPEPSSLALLGLGVAAAFARRRRHS